MIKQKKGWSLFLLMALIISGCGFHLRGDIILPPLYEKVHIVDKGHSDVGNSLARSLTAVGSEIVSSAQEATSVVTILSRGIKRRALNVGGKQIREYELKLTILFAVYGNDGTQLSKPQTVNVMRNFQNDANNVLAKDNEEQVIRKEMMQPAVNQILRRMKAIAQ